MDLSDAVLSDLPNPSLRACRANLIIVLTRSHCSDRELSLSVGISLSCNVRCPAEWRRHSRGSCLDAFLVVRGAGCHNTWAQIIINIMWLPEDESVRHQVLQLLLWLLIWFDQVGENQGVGGRPRRWSLGHPLQRRPGEQPAGHERRGDAEILHGAQDAEVN